MSPMRGFPYCLSDSAYCLNIKITLLARYLEERGGICNIIIEGVSLMVERFSVFSLIINFIALVSSLEGKGEGHCNIILKGTPSWLSGSVYCIKIQFNS